MSCLLRQEGRNHSLPLTSSEGFLEEVAGRLGTSQQSVTRENAWGMGGNEEEAREGRTSSHPSTGLGSGPTEQIVGNRQRAAWSYGFYILPLGEPYGKGLSAVGPGQLSNWSDL